MQDLFDLHDANGPERCGVILESGEIVELTNVHPDPMDHFAMEVPNDGILATWHTHPRTGPNLSMADYKAFVQYPRLRHYIVSATEIWCYVMDQGILCAHDDHHIVRLSPRPSPA